MLTVYNSALANFIDVYTAMGGDAGKALEEVGLAPADLRVHEQMVPAAAVAHLLENAARELGCDNFSVRMVAASDAVDVGPLALLLMGEPTARRALQGIMQYQHLRTHATRFSMDSEHDLTTVHILLHQDLPPHRRQAVELVSSMLLRILQTILGKKWRPAQVRFMHGPPRDLAQHRLLFGLNIAFNCESDSMVLCSADLDVERQSPATTVSTHIRRYLDSQVPQERRSMAQEVRELVSVRLAGGNCQADIIAQQMALPPRTFYHRLRSENTSFAEIVESVRRERVQRLLRQEQVPSLVEVAELLGLSGPSAFSRWFRQRFGCSPSTWGRVTDGVNSRP